MALEAQETKYTKVKKEIKEVKVEDTEIEELLLKQVKSGITDAEDYLDDIVRPVIQENWDYYYQKKPAPINGMSYVDNTCQACVDHLLATSMDAFVSSDSIEVLPEGTSNPIVLKVINSVINDVLDNENNRYQVYNSFFQSAYIARNGIMKPYVCTDVRIDKEFFNNIKEDELAVMIMDYEKSDKYDEVDYVITEEVEQSIEQSVPPEMMDFLGNVEGVAVAFKNVSGYFTLKYTEKTIKIANIPTENFLINKDAESIKDSNLCGHKSMMTASTLLEMGFDEDKVLEAIRKGNSGDSDDNMASIARKVNFTGIDNDSDSDDYSQKEVELYELYIKTSVIETMGKSDSISVSKLYQVYTANDIILDYQEVDEIPYVGGGALPIAHSFWGFSIVDKTKQIQRAKTGATRQIFEFNSIQLSPRFQYKKTVDTRSLLNPRAGTGILVENINDVAPLQIGTLSPATGEILNILDQQKDSGVGITFTGQGMMSDVLKAGGSTVSASMVLSEQQKMQKNMITSMLESGIKPLIKKIYNLLRDNFDSWEIGIDDQTININPSKEWPRLRDVVIKTPLGANAKLEKAGQYAALAQQLSMAQGESGKLFDINGYRNAVIKSYELQGISDVKSYIATPEAIQQKDEMTTMMQQLQQQLVQMQTQMQQITMQNQQLQSGANDIVKKELDLREREVAVKEAESQAKMENMADKQDLAEQEANVDAQFKADQMALKEKMFEVEAQDPSSNVFQSI